jgi:hypothetical protein
VEPVHLYVKEHLAPRATYVHHVAKLISSAICVRLGCIVQLPVFQQLLLAGLGIFAHLVPRLLNSSGALLASIAPLVLGTTHFVQQDLTVLEHFRPSILCVRLVIIAVGWVFQRFQVLV